MLTTTMKPDEVLREVLGHQRQRVLEAEREA